LENSTKEVRIHAIKWIRAYLFFNIHDKSNICISQCIQELKRKHKLIIVWTFFVFGISGIDIIVRTAMTMISMPEHINSYLMLEYHRFVALAIVNFL
jgi:hypothetical protein